MFSKHKKVIILSVMMVLLIATGVLNLVLNRNSTEASAGSSSSANFFQTYRSDRLSTRNQEIAYLDALIATPNITEEQMATAIAQRAEIVRVMDLELNLEALIKSTGFEDAIVNNLDLNFNIVVKANGGVLVQNEVDKIVNILQTQITDIDVDNMTIIPLA